MKVLIITDAFTPQINGVVTTFVNTIKELKAVGYEVDVISPDDFKTMPLPTYKEIKIALNPWSVGKLIEKSNADYIHIATEGPIGLFAGFYCRKKKYNFTTSYHTKMPEYVNARFRLIPTSLVYKYMRLIHKSSSAILVTTDSMSKELRTNKFTNPIIVWGRGVDTTIFNPSGHKPSKLARLLYVGRISVEKNLEAYLDMDVVAMKYVVGDGPLLEYYKEAYILDPYIMFVGAKHGAELQSYYANAEAFVFPSRTDTFGIVMLEAMACGTPTIAYPVTGPKDCIENGVTGILSEDLNAAYYDAISKLDRTKIAEVGATKTWAVCTEVFKSSLVKKLKEP